MDKSQDKKWHAIYTKARCEKKVLDQLRLRKIEAYLPLRTEVHQWSDRKKKIYIPIISSYVFVRISPDERKNIYPISGFVNFVTYRNEIAVISEREMEAMRRVVESNVVIEVESNILTEGQNVTIKSGPLKGIEGRISRVDDKKIHISIEAIGYSLAVSTEDALFDVNPK